MDPTYVEEHDSALYNLTLEEIEERVKHLEVQAEGYATKTPEYDDSAKPAILNLKWMSRVADSTDLVALSIPGTHNTVSLYGGPWSQCQSWSLMDIYRSGVRFADIRCRHFNDTLPIHHELIFQKITFGGVLERTREFLEENPSETILMRIRKEYKAENNKKLFEDVVNEHVTKFMPPSRVWTDSYLPKLKEARGKLIILRDYHDNRYVPYRSLNIDDKWDVKSLLHVNEKWDSVHGHLQKSKNNSLQNGFLTYTSGSSFLAFPSAVAKRINKRLLDMLKQNTGKARWGMIAMDFPGTELIQAIINSNF